MQGWPCLNGPGHNWGWALLLHVRVLNCVPPPHDLVHLENGLQDDQVARRDATTDTGRAPVIAPESLTNISKSGRSSLSDQVSLVEVESRAKRTVFRSSAAYKLHSVTGERENIKGKMQHDSSPS